jgi:hypothetical protein
MMDNQGVQNMANPKDCNHVTLTKLGGPLHPSGSDYYCKECGEQFRVKLAVIGVHFGKPPESAHEEG